MLELEPHLADSPPPLTEVDLRDSLSAKPHGEAGSTKWVTTTMRFPLFDSVPLPSPGSLEHADGGYIIHDLPESGHVPPVHILLLQITMKDQDIVGEALASVLPQYDRPWFRVPHLLQLNVILLVPLLSSAVAGYDGEILFVYFCLGVKY